MTVKFLGAMSASFHRVRAAQQMRKDDRGQDLVEFALVLPFILMLTLAIIDLAHVTMVYAAMVYGAREGARYGIVTPPPSIPQIRTHVLDAIPSAGIKEADIAVLRDDHSVQVTISHRTLTLTGYLLRPFGGTPIMTLQASSHMRTE